MLLSIKPEYAKVILDGQKEYEFRKRRCKTGVNKIVFYSMAPESKVVSEAEIVTSKTLSRPSFCLYGRFGFCGFKQIQRSRTWETNLKPITSTTRPPSSGTRSRRTSIASTTAGTPLSARDCNIAASAAQRSSGASTTQRTETTPHRAARRISAKKANAPCSSSGTMTSSSHPRPL